MLFPANKALNVFKTTYIIPEWRVSPASLRRRGYNSQRSSMSAVLPASKPHKKQHNVTCMCHKYSNYTKKKNTDITQMMIKSNQNNDKTQKTGKAYILKQ